MIVPTWLFVLLFLVGAIQNAFGSNGINSNTDAFDEEVWTSGNTWTENDGLSLEVPTSSPPSIKDASHPLPDLIWSSATLTHKNTPFPFNRKMIIFYTSILALLCFEVVTAGDAFGKDKEQKPKFGSKPDSDEDATKPQAGGDGGSTIIQRAIFSNRAVETISPMEMRGFLRGTFTDIVSSEHGTGSEVVVPFVTEATVPHEVTMRIIFDWDDPNVNPNHAKDCELVQFDSMKELALRIRSLREVVQGDTVKYERLLLKSPECSKVVLINVGVQRKTGATPAGPSPKGLPPSSQVVNTVLSNSTEIQRWIESQQT